jgi:hypothetical protein
MTTAADVVAATRRRLYGVDREQLNQVAVTLAASTAATTLQLTYDLTGIGAGTLLSCGLEVVYVWSVDDSTKQAVVQRGYQGSTVSVWTAGNVVYVNPRFTDFDIFTAVNDDLYDLSSPSSGLYQVRTLDLTAMSGQVGYDLNAIDFLGIADIRWQQQNTVTKEWTELVDYDVNENLPATAFASGTALFLTGAQPTPGQSMRVRYKSRFTQLTDLTTDLATTGLPSTAFDLPPMGAALRLMDAQPVARADMRSQGDTRRADEVRVGEVLQAPAALRQRRTQRIADEARRLNQIWPQRLRARIHV